MAIVWGWGATALAVIGLLNGGALVRAEESACLAEETRYEVWGWNPLDSRLYLSRSECGFAGERRNALLAYSPEGGDFQLLDLQANQAEPDLLGWTREVEAYVRDQPGERVGEVGQADLREAGVELAAKVSPEAKPGAVCPDPGGSTIELALRETKALRPRTYWTRTVKADRKDLQTRFYRLPGKTFHILAWISFGACQGHEGQLIAPMTSQPQVRAIPLREFRGVVTQVRIARGRQAYAKGEFAEAARALDLARELDGGSVELQVELARARLREGKQAAALSALARARSLEPAEAKRRIDEEPAFEKLRESGALERAAAHPDPGASKGNGEATPKRRRRWLRRHSFEEPPAQRHEGGFGSLKPAK